MPRLLILCEYPTLSGGERSMLATLDGVARAGFDVCVMAPGEGPLAEACRERGIEVVSRSVDALLGKPSMSGSSQLAKTEPRPSGSGTADEQNLPLPDGRGSDTLAARRETLARELTRLKPDLLHANSLAMGRLAGPVAAEAGIASIAHLRDIIKLSRQALADLGRNTRLLAVSAATRAFHVAAGLDADKTFVLYNGVDLGRFRPRTPTGYLHRELHIPVGAPLIGSIGQICLRKAQEVLLEAAGMVNTARRLPAAHWLIVGERWSDKPESRQFESRLRATAEQLDGRIHFLGARDDVPELLGELTLLVHTARQEPLGRVLLEAAASGKAVVATDVGGAREIFPPESGAGRLVPPDDPAALAGVVGELLAEPEARLAMGTAARRRAEEHFDAARATAGLVEHYRDVIGG